MNVPDIRETEDGVVIAVKVIPNASNDQISGCIGDRLKIRVSAPPQSGKANKSVCRLLAKALGVRSKDVSVIAGHTNPLKKVEVNGISIDTVLRSLRLSDS